VHENGSRWNTGNWPTNCVSYNQDDVPVIRDIDNRLELYCQLKRGPIYAYYTNSDTESAHLVVVTGYDPIYDIVFTNNPWGISGQQTYIGFLKGFAGGPTDGSYNLYGYMPIKWG